MILSRNIFYSYIQIFLILNIISLIIYFIFIKNFVYEINFVEDDNIKFIVHNFNEDNVEKGMIYFAKMDELRKNFLINILNNKNICLNSANGKIKKHYFHFLKSSFPFINIQREMFGESVDINSYFNDPVDKIYRVALLQKDYDLNIALFSIKKFYNKSYLNEVLESLENVLLKYTIDHHNFSNYNNILNVNYTNLKKNLKRQIYLNIFYKYKNNQVNLTNKNIPLTKYKSHNPNLHFHNNLENFNININTLNDCEKNIFELLFIHNNNNIFISNNKQLSYQKYFIDFKKTIGEKNLKLVNINEINILNKYKYITLILINFFMTTIIFFIMRKL